MHWVGRTLKITLKFKPGIKEKKKTKTKDSFGKQHEHGIIRNQYNQDTSLLQRTANFFYSLSTEPILVSCPLAIFLHLNHTRKQIELREEWTQYDFQQF